MNTESSGASSHEAPSPDSSLSCAEVRDLLPLASSRAGQGLDLTDVEDHVSGCEECRAEAEFVARLWEARPEPPASILESVLEGATSARVDRPRWQTSVWGLSAAAVAVIALGVGVFWDSAPDDSLWTLALEPEPTEWYGDEWMVAGGPVPEALSDDVLRALLEEMDQ